MRKSKFTPEQILQALRQAEAGTVVAEICRKLGVTEGTFYRWKKQYAGLDVAELAGAREALREKCFAVRIHLGLPDSAVTRPLGRRAESADPGEELADLQECVESVFAKAVDRDPQRDPTRPLSIRWRRATSNVQPPFPLAFRPTRQWARGAAASPIMPGSRVERLESRPSYVRKSRPPGG